MTRTLTMTLGPFERQEWHRMASDAYKTGRNEFGHRFSVACAHREMDIRVYDSLMVQYRRWLVGGWNEVENPR